MEGPIVFGGGGFEEKGLEDEGFKNAVSISISASLSLEDKPISSSLDLTTDLNPFYIDIAHNRRYQFKDWCKREYKLVKTGLKALSLETKDQPRGDSHSKLQEKILGKQKRKRRRGKDS